MTDEQDAQPSPIEEERRAIDYIARTPQGRLLHRYLRRILEAVYDVEDSGALRTHTGRRTLARDLMRLMADGIEATRAPNDGKRDDPILNRASSAVRSGRAYRTVRDYITASGDDPGGFDPRSSKRSGGSGRGARRRT